MSCISHAADVCASRVAASTGRSCTWCGGACLNEHQASGVPCGENDGADAFWDAAHRCFAASTNQKDCLDASVSGAAGSCAWCVLEDPSVGVCVSRDSRDKLIHFNASRTDLGEASAVSFAGNLMNCVIEPDEGGTDGGEDVNGVHDMSCLRLNAFEKDACQSGSDAIGRPCVFVDHFLAADLETRSIDVGLLCLSQAQEGVLNKILSTMKSINLKWFVMPETDTADAENSGN